MKTIDLHIHTTASDGTFSPTELVDYGLKKNLSALAITDHDTMRGIAEALEYRDRIGADLEIIPGMEISANAPGFYFGLHILAYFPDKSPEELENIINNLERELRQGDGSPRTAIKTVMEYGGLTSLGHPQEYSLSMGEMDKLLGDLAALGLNGVEGIYTTHSSAYISEMKKLARKHGLLVTGGTDFHGARKPGVDLGCGFGDMTIPYDIVESLKALSATVRS
ncbi:MAG: PHP domain-containing protein [Spirochaetales bacterium]|nr:PHP domain-containing protein [Spirochaetales bacterium]